MNSTVLEYRKTDEDVLKRSYICRLYEVSKLNTSRCHKTDVSNLMSEKALNFDFIKKLEKRIHQGITKLMSYS